MADFIAITTQEEFDARLADRLKRERNSVTKEFDGFLSPDDVNKKLEALGLDGNGKPING